MSRPVEYMRADAARNVQRIIEVAARLLSENPSAGMGDLASEAGISRATVYRHFATREALIDAIAREASAQAERSVAETRLGEGSATEALERLVGAWLDLADRFAFLQLAPPSLSDEDREHRRRVLREPLLELIRRGQAAGEFSAAVSPEWAARVVGALVQAGARAVGDGTLSRAAAGDAVVDTLLGGLRP